jgi:hypothetical protein
MNKIVSGTIYALHNGDHNYRYIGLTTKTPEERLKGHIDTAKYDPKKNPHKSRWIVKNTNSNSLFIEVLEYYPDIPLKDLHKREMVCIAKAKLEGWSLLNATEGGEGTVGIKMSPEAVEAMRERLTGRKNGPRPEEVRKRISESHMGIRPSDETRAKLSAWHSGKTLSEEHKANIAKGNHRRYHVNRDIVKDDCRFCITIP